MTPPPADLLPCPLDDMAQALFAEDWPADKWENHFSKDAKTKAVLWSKPDAAARRYQRLAAVAFRRPQPIAGDGWEEAIEAAAKICDKNVMKDCQCGRCQRAEQLAALIRALSRPAQPQPSGEVIAYAVIVGERPDGRPHSPPWPQIGTTMGVGQVKWTAIRDYVGGGPDEAFNDNDASAVAWFERAAVPNGFRLVPLYTAAIDRPAREGEEAS